MSATINVKHTLRSNMKQVLRSLTEDSMKEQSDIVLKKLLNLKCYKSSNRVGVYLNMKDEIQTNLIVRNIFETGKQCFIPWYNKDVMKLIKLESAEDLATLQLTKWNIKQHADIKGREDALSSGGLDLVLIPGLAFTTSGKRLGRGKGYYDRFLFDMANNTGSNNGTIQTIGLAFREQIVEDIPCSEHDYKLDMILSPDTTTNIN